MGVATRKALLAEAERLQARSKEIKDRLTAEAGSEAPVAEEPRLAAFRSLIETAVRTKDPSILENALDLPAFVSRVVRADRLGASVESQFKDVVAEDLRATGRHLIDIFAKGGRYDYLRSRRTPSGDATLLFRLITERGGVNYHEFLGPAPGARRSTGTPPPRESGSARAIGARGSSS